MLAESYTGSSTTNWVYPTGSGTSGTISQADTSLCMQIDHNDNNVVREAPCSDGGTPEEWTNKYVNGRTEFLSVWADQSLGGGQWCLTWQDYLTGSEAYVDPCGNFGSTQNGWGTS